jgi:hypothetical protein
MPVEDLFFTFKPMHKKITRRKKKKEKKSLN